MKAQDKKTKLPILTVMARAVIYARVSRDDRSNEGRNLAGQLEMGRNYAHEKGYRVVEELAEDERGVSGVEIDLPQLNRVREMAYNSEFDVLIVRELDRLSRNLAKQLIIEEELRQLGVRIEYVLSEYDDTPEGHFQKHIRATVAEYEKEKIRERMIRGRRNKVKAGNILTSGGRCPYGYKVEKLESKTVLVLDEEKAEIVRLIFYWYVVEGLSMAQISRKLNEMGAPIPNGIRTNTLGWLASSVGKLLKNETYTGTWYYGKYNSRKRKMNPREHWIAVDVPAIISRKVWQDAQDRLKQNKEESKRNRKRNYLLSHRVTCGDCNCKCSGWSNQKRMYYICHSRSKESRPRDCRLPYIRADHLDTTVWLWVVSKVLDPDELERGLADYQVEQEKQNAPLREQLRVTENLLAENQAQLDRLLDLYLSGEFSKEMLTDRKVRFEETVSKLEREKKNLVAQLEAGQLTDEQIQTIKEFTSVIREELENVEAEHDFDVKRRIIELLDVRVTVKVEDGLKVAYVQYKLGKEEKPIPIVDTTTSESPRRFSFPSTILSTRLMMPDFTPR